MKRISGATRVAAVIGDPVRHSLSPVILNAAFDALDLDWIYAAFTVPDGAGEAAVDAARTLGLGGLSVTMPHKAAACAAVDERTPDAEALGAANCVFWRGDVLVGDNTDGPGFLDALRIDEGVDPAGRRALVLGAGGAARAVIRALAEAGVAEVVVVNRTAATAATAVTLAGTAGRSGTAQEATACDIVVNATPVGMGTVVTTDGAPEDLPLDPANLGAGQVVVDLVYDPLSTPLLDAARARGAVAVNGLGMLIHQAAHAFRRWTNEDPPLEVMSAAAVAATARPTV